MWNKSYLLPDSPKKKSLFEPSPYQYGYAGSAAVSEAGRLRDIPTLNLTPIEQAQPSQPKPDTKEHLSKYGQYSDRKRYSDYVTTSKGLEQKTVSNPMDTSKSQRSSYNANDSGLPKDLKEQLLRYYEKGIHQIKPSTVTRTFAYSNELATQLSPRSSNKASIQHIDNYKQLLSPRQTRLGGGDGIPVLMKSFSAKDSSYTTSASFQSEEAKENCTDSTFKLKDDLASPRNGNKYFKKDPVREKRCYNSPREQTGDAENSKYLESQRSSRKLLVKPQLPKQQTETNIKTKSTFGEYIKQKITPAAYPNSRYLYFSGIFTHSRSKTDLRLPPTPPELLSLSIKDFDIGKCRGDGKFGRVSMCRHRYTSTFYAIKEIPKAVIRKNCLEKQLTWEVKIQMFFDHVNIVKLYGFFADTTNVYLLMEYMEGGTMFDYLKKQNGKGLPEEEVCKRMREVCSAVYYMHDLQVAHRDIKPYNIVLSNGVAKLCDFGWSTLTHERRSTYCGTFDYSSPYMLEGKQYDYSIDLWSLGVLAFELLTGKLPFYSVSRKETIKNITSVGDKNIAFPADMSWEARSFIEGLLRKEPDQRREAEMLLRHPFLTKYKERLY